MAVDPAEPAQFGLPPATVGKLRAQLPQVATHTVAAIIDEVPGYASALGGSLGVQIEGAVRMALGGFLNLASQRSESAPGAPLKPTLDAAYALGRGEARSGRSMDALLAAYRVGARVAWRELATVAVASRLSGQTLVEFAELVFAYIDELSAASLAGHSAELASVERLRQRQLDRLARSLAAGEAIDVLLAAADRAEWPPPATLCAVLLQQSSGRDVSDLVDPRTLIVADDLPAAADLPDAALLLVPDLSTSARTQLRAELSGRGAIIGPSRPWAEVSDSYLRALKAARLGLAATNLAIDTEEHLAALVLGSDEQALSDLRAQVLAPLSSLRTAAAETMAQTLRAWALHQGRRADIAAALFVHPQTVRYRIGQLRELYGEKLADPDFVLALTVALGTA